jgi:archaetidylinositol phosphate synthase
MFWRSSPTARGGAQTREPAIKLADSMSDGGVSNRINASLFASPERKLLHLIVSRLPFWCTPDGLTVLGLFGCGLVMLGYWFGRWNVGWMWLANLGLVVHWAGDSLDGTLARFRGIARPRYGFYLDQGIDVLGNLMITLGVGLSNNVRLDFALLVLATYHMLAIQTYLRTIVDGTFHVDVGGLGPTEMRLAIMLMNIGIMAFGAPVLLTVNGRALTWCDGLLLLAAVGLLVLYGFEMRRHLKRIGQEDPPRAERS